MKDKKYVQYCWDQNNYINVMVYAFKKTDENSTTLGYKKPRNAVNQLVNPLDALKQGAWVATGIKKDGSEAKRWKECKIGRAHV